MKYLFSWLIDNWAEIVTIFTTVFTAILLYKQYIVQRNQIRWQMSEHQPLLQFTRTDDCLSITNVGDAMLYPAKIKILTLLRADTISKPNKDKRSKCLSCIPFQYFEDIAYTNNLDGQLAQCKFVQKSEREELLQVVRNFTHEVTKETFEF